MWRLGEEPDAPWIVSNTPRHALLDGFDLHANVAVPARDRTRLEQSCRYLLRPAVSRVLLVTTTPAGSSGTRAQTCDACDGTGRVTSPDYEGTREG